MLGHIMMLIWIFALCILGYTTLLKGQIVSVSLLQTNGSSVILQCQTVIPKNATNINHRWKFNKIVLTKNGKLLVTSSRYSVGYLNRNETVYTLTIQNPVKADEGVYQCKMKYTKNSSTYSDSKNVDVKIDSYLPAIRYPLCRIRPSTTLRSGNFAKFVCDVGEATAEITLNLTLQSHNGSVTYLGGVTVKRKVTSWDNNSMFICHMTSTTFPTAYRNCSAGPLTIHVEEPYTEEMSTQPIRSMTTALTTKPEKESTTEASKTTQNLMTTKHLTWTNQHGTSNSKHVSKHAIGERLSTVSLMTDDNKMYMNDHGDEATSPPNMYIILTSLIGVCQTIVVIVLFMLWYNRKQRPTSESITVATSSNQVLPPVDSTNKPYQIDSEAEPNINLKEADDPHTRTMILLNPVEDQNMHTYEHSIEMHSMTTPSSHPSHTADSTYMHMPHKTDSKPGINVVRMGVASLVKTNMATPIQISPNQALQTVDSTYTPYQTDCSQEPTAPAVFNQIGDSHTGTMTLLNPEHPNIHD